jgi:RNA polymerase sigma-70 factor (ECF subfamily)
MPESPSSNCDDATLVKQAKSGDSRAFGTLYERYAADIYRFLNAQLPNYVEAEDLTSDVFLRAWQSLPRYRERGYSFSAYLYKIARNALIDHWRKKKKDGRVVDLPLDDLYGETTDSGDRVIRYQENETLRRALNELKADYRSVLVLRFINGLTILEIASIMGRSEGAIRVLQHRALLAVRRKMPFEGSWDEEI